MNIYTKTDDINKFKAVEELIEFLGKLCNNWHTLYSDFYGDYENELSGEYKLCDCGCVLNYCRCYQDDDPNHDIYDDEGSYG